MRSFNLRILVYAIEECNPKLIICNFLLYLPRIYAIFQLKNTDFSIKIIKFKKFLKLTLLLEIKKL